MRQIQSTVKTYLRLLVLAQYACGTTKRYECTYDFEFCYEELTRSSYDVETAIETCDIAHVQDLMAVIT